MDDTRQAVLICCEGILPPALITGIFLHGTDETIQQFQTVGYYTANCINHYRIRMSLPAVFVLRMTVMAKGHYVPKQWQPVALRDVIFETNCSLVYYLHKLQRFRKFFTIYKE
jgi:hypothetical protein